MILTSYEMKLGTLDLLGSKCSKEDSCRLTI